MNQIYFLFILVAITAVFNPNTATAQGNTHKPNTTSTGASKHIISTISLITFAADNKGIVFVNGKKVGRVAHWNVVKKVRLPLAKGDVISMIATDFGTWYGAIVDVMYRGMHYGTGHAGWKAVKMFHSKRNRGWMQQAYSSCFWPDAHVLPRSAEMFSGKARRFPFRSKAEYVWANNAGEKDTVFLRFVLGGEDCSSAKKQGHNAKGENEHELKKETDAKIKHAIDEAKENDVKKEHADGVAKATDIKGEDAHEVTKETDVKEEDAHKVAKETEVQKEHGHDVAQETDFSGSRDKADMDECFCKVAEGAPGTCWDILGDGMEGACESRDCDATYECALNDNAAPMVCYRRLVTQRVVRKSDGLCRKVATVPTSKYIPYQARM